MKYPVRITPIALEDAEEFYLWKISKIPNQKNQLKLQIGYQQKQIKHLLKKGTHK
jgi:hypothetical protein